MDWIRDLVNAPIFVHCAYRPVKYNKQIGGAKRSAHLYGLAVDWSVKGVDPEYLRQLILPYLPQLKMRLEAGTKTWVHSDQRKPYIIFNP